MARCMQRLVNASVIACKEVQRYIAYINNHSLPMCAYNCVSVIVCVVPYYHPFQEKSAISRLMLKDISQSISSTFDACSEGISVTLHV